MYGSELLIPDDFEFCDGPDPRCSCGSSADEKSYFVNQDEGTNNICFNVSNIFSDNVGDGSSLVAVLVLLDCRNYCCNCHCSS